MFLVRYLVSNGPAQQNQTHSEATIRQTRHERVAQYQGSLLRGRLVFRVSERLELTSSPVTFIEVTACAYTRVTSNRRAQLGDGLLSERGITGLRSNVRALPPETAFVKGLWSIRRYCSSGITRSLSPLSLMTRYIRHFASTSSTTLDGSAFLPSTLSGAGTPSSLT